MEDFLFYFSSSFHGIFSQVDLLSTFKLTSLEFISLL